MKVIKTDKHYMAEPDFEIDHYKDASYPPVASHYHEFYEFFLFVSGNAVGKGQRIGTLLRRTEYVEEKEKMDGSCAAAGDGRGDRSVLVRPVHPAAVL